MVRIEPSDPGDEAKRWEHLALWEQQLRSGDRSPSRLHDPRPRNVAVADDAKGRSPSDAPIEDGLSLSDALRARTGGSTWVSRDMQEGIALLDVADSALTDSVAILERIRLLTLEAAAGSYPAEQRRALQAAVDYSVGELEAVGERTTYNARTFRDLAGDPPVLPAASAEAPVVAASEPEPVAGPRRVPVVTGVTVMFSGGRGGEVESWTGSPVGGIYTLSGGQVRDGLGRTVGSCDGRTVTFGPGTSVTFGSSVVPASRTGSATFTLTPEIRWEDADTDPGVDTDADADRDAAAEEPRPADVAPVGAPPSEPAGTPAPFEAPQDEASSPGRGHRLSVLTREESAVSARRVDQALGSLVRLHDDMGSAARAVLRQDAAAATPEADLTSVIARLKQTDIAAEAVAAARYDLLREFGRTLVGLVAVAHRDAVALLSA